MQGGRLQALQTGTSLNPILLQDLWYSYDAVGNIRTIQDTKNSNQKQCFQYDGLHRLTNATTYTDTPQGCTTQVGAGNYAEAYSYDPAGNLDVKAGVDLNYNDTAHVHAVTHIGATQKYWYDQNGNQTTRIVGADTFNLIYDAENRLVEVKKNSVTMATFVYDGDGRRVRSTVNGTTTYFIGAHYEVTGSQVTKFYFAGTQRVAMRKYIIPQSMTVEYFLGDHLGSTSLTTDNTGAKVSEMRYKPWGEVRSWWTAGLATTPLYKLPDYTFTGQFSYMDDSSTTGVTEGFGLMFYQSRFYDPVIGHFTQADTIVPPLQGVQAWDRYAFVNNNPVRYTDPTGHMVADEDEGGSGISCTTLGTCPTSPAEEDEEVPDNDDECDGDPFCLLDVDFDFDDIPLSAEFWSTTSKVLDITALVADFGLEALALLGLIIGGGSGAAFVDPITGLPGVVVKGAAGAFVGWSLVQLGVQPFIQANNFVALLATLSGAIGDDKMGNSDINLRTTLSSSGLTFRVSGYASSSTLTAAAITATGFSPAGSLTETSTLLQIGAVLNDFGKLPIPGFSVPFSNVPVSHWP